MDTTLAVELIRVHYYDPSKQFSNIPTISQRVPVLQEPVLLKNNQQADYIRRSIFGQKWVLEINKIEENDKSKCRWNLLAFVVVAFCLIIAVLCGVYFSLDNFATLRNITIIEESRSNSSISSVDDIFIWDFKLIGNNESLTSSETNEQKSTIENEQNVSTISFEYCQNCIRPQHICLKLTPDGPPSCEQSRDLNDLTGCGGYCMINTEYCKLLDKKHLVYECLEDYTTLECLDGGFSCGNHCISENKTCDGFIDCQDKSDELNCDCLLDNHFRCLENISCFENFRKCDGKVDCWDASDEIGCSSNDCLSTEVACINGGCIDLDVFCDGIPHCEDKSDEPSGCEVLPDPKH